MQDELPAEVASELTEQASELRNLVRIKVEDDNDLKLVRQALRESALFFKDLRHFTRHHQKLGAASAKNKASCELDLLEELRYMSA